MTIKLIPTFCIIAGMFVYSINGIAEIHGAITTTSDYVWRGYSKSDGGFALQANIDYEHTSSGVYFGISSSSVDFGDSDQNDHAHVEITPYLGWTTEFWQEWRMDLQMTRYFYDGKIFGKHSDYNEFYLMIHYRDFLSGRVSFSENYFNRDKATGDFGLIGRYPITDSLELSSGVGYSLTKEVTGYDYLYWDVGLSYFYNFAVFDFRYVDALDSRGVSMRKAQGNGSDFPHTLDATFVFSFSIGF